jgi:hydroxyethylthiazole kinase-like uncharacterized protein yjeF
VRLATVAEAKRIDELAQSRFGLTGEMLMEAAGALSAREIEQSFIVELASGKGIAVVCGPGNNGGDGLVVARHLAARGVTIYLLAPEKSRSVLFKLQLVRCRKLGLRIINALETPDALAHARQAALIVDALFGIGIKKAIAPPFTQAVALMQTGTRKSRPDDQRAPPVVSLDVPSGLDSDRGIVFGGGPGDLSGDASGAVTASLTITFGLAKPGFFLSDGPRHVGRVRVLQIGYPNELLKTEARSTFAFTETQALRALPSWPATAHKSDHGHALLLAGSDGMHGAALLASTSAYRVGAGYVTLASHEEPLEILKTFPEILTSSALNEKLWGKRRWTAAGIGPGLGAQGAAGAKTAELLEKLARISGSRVVVDADALTVLSEQKQKRLPAEWILTPHAGELARLLKCSAEEIESDRFRAARDAAERFGCHVLLKGFRSVVAEPGGERASVILSGNSALAKAGTGDVLTGMITGLLAQGVKSMAAAMTGAYIHGRMADEWVRAGNSKRALTATDLRDILPGLLVRLGSARA